MIKALISYFAAFDGRRDNCTELVAHMLLEKGWANRGFDFVKLPVSFLQCWPTFKKTISLKNYQYIIGLGEAKGRDKISLERVAINLMDAPTPDNDGHQPINSYIVEKGETAYFSTLPLLDLQQSLKNQKIPAEISNTAGTYVCNTLMYNLLAHTVGSSIQAGFIHVPLCERQIENKEDAHMQLKKIVEGIELILDLLK